MLVAGIIITIVAVLMMIFPEIFILLKNPKISRTSLKSKKVKNAFRILSALYVVIGIITDCHGTCMIILSSALVPLRSEGYY